MDEVAGQPDKAQVATEYTDDLPELGLMLKNLYPRLKKQKMKNRFKRLQNSLKTN